MNPAAENTNEANKRTELAMQETIIARGQQAFMSTARAVARIASQKLYAPEYANATAYFAERWSMSGADVSRYKAAASVLEELELQGFAKLPDNEGQARALAEIKTSERRLAVWNAAITGEEPVTAKLIRKLAAPQPATDEQKQSSEAAEQTPIEAPVPSMPSVAHRTERLHTAVIQVQAESTAFNEMLVCEGISASQIGDDLYEFRIGSTEQPELLQQMAKWSALCPLRRLTITFE